MQLALPFARLGRDTRGATLVEFAFVAPALCVTLLGGMDIAHTLYMRAVLQGAIQKAARDSSLENGADAAMQATLDGKVRDQVLPLARNATFTSKRRFYRSFAKASEKTHEEIVGDNGNGQCDHGESFLDANNNNIFDDDGGDAGQGGAQDATVYTVTVSYPRMFPVIPLIGGPATQSISASTVLRNQPYGDQGSYAAPVPVACP
jgi:Flp pilus assembly protein TadG